VERHFADGLEFFGDPDFRQVPGMAVAAFGVGSYNAWTLGRADLASERQSQMMRIAETPYDVAVSAQVTAQLLIYKREYEQAEVFAKRGHDVSEKNGFTYITALGRGALGYALAQLIWRFLAVAETRTDLKQAVYSLTN